MKLCFEVTVDDWIAVERYRWDRSLARLERHVVRPRSVLLTGVVVFVMAALVVEIEVAAGMAVIACGVICCFHWVLKQLAFRPNPQFWNRYKESLPHEAVGLHELELTDEDLVEKTPNSVRRIALEDVKEIDSVGDHTFLHTEPVRGCVIPHHAVTQGNVEAFVEAVRMRVSEMPAGPSAAAGPARSFASEIGWLPGGGKAMRPMTSEQPSPQMICGAAVVILLVLVLVLYALSLVGNLIGPSEWQWLGIPAFFVTIPIVFLLTGFPPGMIRASAPHTERRPWLRPCRYLVGGLAAVCIVATVAGFVGLLITMRGAASINSGDGEPIFHSQGPYMLHNQPVSRARWVAAAVSFQLAWHGFGMGWLLGLVYRALSEPKAPATGPGSEAEPLDGPESQESAPRTEQEHLRQKSNSLKA
jgi:hypothetical protein